jgi:hypothetical protein
MKIATKKMRIIFNKKKTQRLNLKKNKNDLKQNK